MLSNRYEIEIITARGTVSHHTVLNKKLILKLESYSEAADMAHKLMDVIRLNH
jgi:hypothetical protein